MATSFKGNCGRGIWYGGSDRAIKGGGRFRLRNMRRPEDTNKTNQEKSSNSTQVTVQPVAAKKKEKIKWNTEIDNVGGECGTGIEGQAIDVTNELDDMSKKSTESLNIRERVRNIFGNWG